MQVKAKKLSEIGVKFVGIVWKNKHGNRYVGKPQRVDGPCSGWIRYDGWEDKDGHITRTSIHSYDADDTSNSHGNYPTGYHPDCGFCWLNAPHTELFHQCELSAKQGIEVPRRELCEQN